VTTCAAEAARTALVTRRVLPCRPVEPRKGQRIMSGEAAMSIDTLAYAKELKAAGVAEQAAEAHAAALNKAVQGGLATKQDLDALEARFYSRMVMFLAVQAFAILALTAAMMQAIK
jgi:hypothetical protein